MVTHTCTCIMHTWQRQGNIYTQDGFLFFQRKTCPECDSNPRHWVLGECSTRAAQLYTWQASKEIRTQDSFFFISKKKLPWVGFKPTTLRVLGERSTNWATRACTCDMCIPSVGGWQCAVRFLLISAGTLPEGTLLSLDHAHRLPWQLTWPLPLISH